MAHSLENGVQEVLGMDNSIVQPELPLINLAIYL
jgi:hypothetical protein